MEIPAGYARKNNIVKIKKSGSKKIAVIILKFEHWVSTHTVMCLKDADTMEMSVDPDQSLQEQSDLSARPWSDFALKTVWSWSTLFAKTCTRPNTKVH